MALKIRVFKGDQRELATTVTIPGGVLKIASSLIPHKAAEALREQGVELKEIVKLSDNPDAHGDLIEIEDHQKNEKTVISLE